MERKLLLLEGVLTQGQFLFRQKIFFRYCHVEYGISQRLLNKKVCRGRKGLCLREANASISFLSRDLRAAVRDLHLTPHRVMESKSVSVMEWRSVGEYRWLACICRQSSCAQMGADEHNVDTFVKELPCFVFPFLLSRLQSVNESISRAARRSSLLSGDMRPNCTTLYLSALRKTKNTPRPFEIGLGKGDRPHQETPDFSCVSAPQVRAAMKTRCSPFRANIEIPHTLYLQCCKSRF